MSQYILRTIQAFANDCSAEKLKILQKKIEEINYSNQNEIENISNYQENIATTSKRTRIMNEVKEEKLDVEHVQISDETYNEIINALLDAQEQEMRRNTMNTAGFNDGDFHVYGETDQHWFINDGLIEKNEKLTELELSEKELKLISS